MYIKEVKLKILLGCDPLLQQLTGIGNYTLQLGKGLANSNDLDELDFFAHGVFFSDELLSNLVNDSERGGPKVNLLSTLRSKLASSQVGVKLYQMITPHLMRMSLRNHSDFIFHSPNFSLPPFDGRKVVTIHDLSIIRFPQYHPKSRVNFVHKAIVDSIKRADHIITPSEFVRNEIIQLMSGEEDKVTAIPLGASPSYIPRSEFECRDILSVYEIDYKRFFLFVSTIEPRKNIECLLNAFQLYRERCPDGFPLILVGGSGWNNESTLERIKVLEGKGWVRYLGYIPQCHLPILYSAARGLLFPSIYEGFGLPVLESMQSGTAVVTCNKSSMSEITSNCAALIEPHDVDGLAGQITKLDKDSDYEASLVESGLVRAIDFSWSKCVADTINIYKKL